jgi:uncharacterized protein (TIGR03066 family)
MKKIVLAVAVLLMAVVVSARAQEGKGKEGKEDRGVQVTSAKLVGVWTWVKSKNRPAGATMDIEFTRDGKVKLSGKVKVKGEEKEFKAQGTYKILEGGFTLRSRGPKGKEQTHTFQITKLTDTELVTRHEKGGVSILTKKPTTGTAPTKPL